ncbi:MAG: hypothetical protein KDE33_28000 [Bacteroidetes bacterium]|nr:hypothetical protein [Bacteroidota bacterium]
MKRISQYCQVTRDCTEVELGVLKVKYRCNTCQKEFERDTYFKQTAGLGLTLIAFIIGMSDNSNNGGSNHHS